MPSTQSGIHQDGVIRILLPMKSSPELVGVKEQQPPSWKIVEVAVPLSRKTAYWDWNFRRRHQAIVCGFKSPGRQETRDLNADIPPLLQVAVENQKDSNVSRLTITQ